ncbi:MAG: 3-hydroxyacyl-ACP dehydratase FabZ family protein [Tepidisphaeraceae bacterium]
MPPQFLFDLSGIDLNRLQFDQEAVRQRNPQRGDMEQLNGIVFAAPERGQVIGLKVTHEKEFWVPGHIPGRPLLPGVLMIEAAAQVASFYTREFVGWKGFIGFGGVEDCKFRMQVPPGKRMYILAQKIWERHKRILCKTQGVVDGQLAFEASIVGSEF